MSKLLSVETLLRDGNGRHKVGHSLFLDVRGRKPGHSGSALWEFRQKIPGTNKVKSIMLGTALGEGALTTSDAMRARWAYDGEQKELAHVAHVVEAKSELSMTFADAVKKFIAKREPDKDAVGRLQNHAKALNARPIGLITPEQVADVMVALGWNGNRGHTAGRVRADIEAVLGFNDVPNNPATWARVKGKLPKVDKTETVHHASMDYRKIPEFMAWLAGHNGTPQARALKFCTLTAARIGEALGARWSEIDLKEKLWTVPASRMKAGKEHIVPLSDAAIAALGKPGDAETLVFAVSDKTTQRHLQKFDPEATQHGLRSTFAVWCEEAIDTALAHATKSNGNGGNEAVRAAYLRSPLLKERRGVMDRWAKHCTALSKARKAA
jgi:integrase